MFIIFDEGSTRRLVLSVLGTLLIMWALGAVVQLRENARVTAAIAALPSPVFTPTPAPMLTFVPPVVAPTEVARELADYPVYGPAAELRSDVWLNTDAPLRLADLRGRVILLMFWAFNCPPCMPVLPYASEWHDTYADQGLTVIGIHTPNRDSERDYDSLVEALVRLDVPYPVAQDNEGLTWQSYGQEVWPTLYLIDRRGLLRYQHIGVGGYPATETAIQALLGEDS